MRCEEFERIVTDLACEFLIEAALRKRALAHAQACPRCAVLLQQERRLTAALTAVASAETAQAPARTKAALLAAFQPQTSTAVPTPPLVMTRPLRRHSRGVMVAAAAAVTLAAILVVLSLLHQQTKVESPTAAEPAVGKAFSSPGSSLSTGSVNGQSSLESKAEKPETQKPSTLDKEDQIVPPRTTRRRVRPIFSPVLARTNRRAATETVTDFIPLTAIADSTAMRSGTIVRVEMPRASLIAMGLPLQVERADETVKADIVVGDDGLARAIRLVY